MAPEDLARSFILFLYVTSALAIQHLHSIRDLRNIDFGGAVPKHSLVLLHWFANNIDIDNNDVISLTFEPNQEDYGTHHYGNYERLLNNLPHSRSVTYRYYTLGNLYRNNNLHSPLTLPSYVTQGNHNLRDDDENRDRIIFRLRRDTSSETIDEVYITQHYGTALGISQYDPEYTYRVSTNLLRELREFSVEGHQRNSLWELRDQFGNHVDDNLLGYLNRNWVRLHREKKMFCGLWTTMGSEICRGPEFENPKGAVCIEGYDALLQLFVEEGKSCARLYIKNTFTDWKKQFEDSWVGFYTSANKVTHEYETWKWQWATKFSREPNVDGYNVYVYCSRMAIAPGVQARFIVRGKENAIAHTAAW
ncbi:uncharacterized protein FYW47_011883 [Aplochiton taeniatus]